MAVKRKVGTVLVKKTYVLNIIVQYNNMIVCTLVVSVATGAACRRPGHRSGRRLSCVWSPRIPLLRFFLRCWCAPDCPLCTATVCSKHVGRSVASLASSLAHCIRVWPTAIRRWSTENAKSSGKYTTHTPYYDIAIPVADTREEFLPPSHFNLFFSVPEVG